ncbi:HD domain-containing protein [uncultured Desulfovibrio sp.]|uniref:HD domain-containing protein n=1 Tax=uncultured Desulfovibrio sp. TaxID=167968 RepID=UPI002608D885|nr:HD domain-containing protein [uncultured Desulfovibrio sp.]
MTKATQQQREAPAQPQTALPAGMDASLEHGRRVARFAQELFQATGSLHGLDDMWGEVLTWAARLHDVGWIGGQRRHHRRSAAMIREDAVPGYHVPDAIREEVALVARYHRRRAPSRRQKRFRALDPGAQRAVCCLAALLRLADALDYSHSGAVQQLEARVENTALVLSVVSPLGCYEELERVRKKAALFRRVFGMEVTWQCRELSRA